MRTHVYWIRAPEHRDITCEGYVGITVKRPAVRFNEHAFTELARGKPRCKRIGEELRARGRKGVILETVCIADRAYALELEKLLRPVAGIGWNTGAGGFAPLAGRVVSERTRKKLSVAGAGRKRSAETRARCSASKMGNQYWRGRTHTAETKAKISESLRGQIISEETRAKLSVAHKGRVMPREGVERSAASRRGKTYGEEVRQKMREACARRLPKTCPHCGLIGKGGNMVRYHFDQCPSKI